MCCGKEVPLISDISDDPQLGYRIWGIAEQGKALACLPKKTKKTKKKAKRSSEASTIGTTKPERERKTLVSAINQDAATQTSEKTVGIHVQHALELKPEPNRTPFCAGHRAYKHSASSLEETDRGPADQGGGSTRAARARNGWIADWTSGEGRTGHGSEPSVGLIDKFSPMGIEMAKRTRKQQEMVDATKAKLASIEAALDKAEVKEVNWTWSARGTYLRGFTTRSNLIQDWVVPPGYSCTETRCEDGR